MLYHSPFTPHFKTHSLTIICSEWLLDDGGDVTIWVIQLVATET